MARRPSHHPLIVSRRVPKHPGPTVHAVKVEAPGTTLYVCGLLPLDPPLGKPCVGPIRKQTERVLTHLKAVVEDGGLSLSDVVRCTLYLTDLKHMAIVDEVYGKMFVSLALPARTVLKVSELPLAVDICVDAIAVRQADPIEAPPPPAEDPYGEPY